MDFRLFRRHSTVITVERYIAGYDADGIYQREVSENFTIIGTPMPYRTVYPTEVFEPERGERVENRLILFCNEKLYIDDPAKAHKTSDIVVINDEIYKPVSVENWNFQNTCRHYRYVLRSFDGY